MAVIILGVVLAGCSQDPRQITVSPLETLPFDSVADWRSYADFVAVVTVERERRADDPLQARQTDQDPLRYVTVAVEQTLWSRAETPPRAFEFQTDGWVTSDGKEVEVRSEGAPRIELGQRYVIGFTHTKGEYAAMTSSSVLPLDGERIHVDARDRAGALSLDELTAAQLRSRILAAKPNPLAEAMADFEPGERYGRVRQLERAQAESGRSTTTTP